MEFTGIYCANIVPFTPDGKKIRFDELEQLYVDLKQNGVAGMVCNGHAGEGELLTRAEKLEVVQLARIEERAPGGRVMDAGLNAGFFSNNWGFLPWAWGDGLLDGFDLLRIE